MKTLNSVNCAKNRIVIKLLVVIFLKYSEGNITINKCCGLREVLNASAHCVPEKNISQEYDWFPISSIVNMTTMKIHKTERHEYLKLLKSANIRIGYRPECSQNDTDTLTFREVKPNFHFLLFSNSDLRFYAKAWKTWHHPSQAYNFSLAEENVEMDFKNKHWENNEGEIKVDQVKLRTFPTSDVCVDAVLGLSSVHAGLLCPCHSVPCIRKCCKDNEYLHIGTKGKEDLCLPVSAEPRLDQNTSKWRPNLSKNGVIDQYYLLTDTFPVCETPLLLKMPIESYKKCTSFNKESDNDFMIYPNGSVKIKKYKNPYPPEKYCGEVTWHDNGKIYEQNLIVCSAGKQAQNQKYKPLKFILYGSLLLLGGVCLLITVAVSLFLPELRRRIHNKIALSHNFSLMIAYFAWGTAQLSPNLGDNSCIFLSLLIQFTFLGSFFWLNVMCIDISMTFSATRSLGGKFNSESSKKFYYYCLYSWGSTAIISVITMVMEFLPEVPFYVLRPGFTCSCGFNTETSAIFIYFYGPMAVLLVINLILFIFTTIKIMTIQRQTAILHKTESNTSGGVSYQTDKQRLILYAKLFLLMGLTWVSEILSWAIGGPDYYWYFSDMINLLRAVFIFILFICKKPVYLSMKRKFNGEPFSFSHKTGSSKSTTDVISITTSGRDSRFRSSTSSSKRRDTQSKMEVDLQKKLSITRQTPDILSRNFNEFEESKI